MPVNVDTATIIPRRASPAPSAAANSGSSGVLPIWYAERTRKSARVSFRNPFDTSRPSPVAP